MINNEQQWLEGALRGDPQSFSQLVEAYQQPVYNLCYRMLGNPAEAEDAAQETFLRAYNSLKRYDQTRPFSTWILSIAAHYCIDQIRKRRAQIVSYDERPELEPPDLGPGPEAALLASEEQRKIQRLLAALDPQDRAAIIMLYWHQKSYEEIAETLNLSVSAVKSRLHRARIELASLWMENKPTGGTAAERKRHGIPTPVF